MTNLIRNKHVFHYHWKTFEAKDITVEQFLLLNIDEKEWLNQIFLECNEEIPTLNHRQLMEFMRIIMWWEEEKKDVMDKLTETQRKIEESRNKMKKEKQIKKEKQKIEEFLSDWHIIEWQMMYTLHQSLSEMRKWSYKYFMDQYKDLWIVIWAKEYNKTRNSKTPDKSSFKKEFWNFYK